MRCHFQQIEIRLVFKTKPWHMRCVATEVTRIGAASAAFRRRRKECPEDAVLSKAKSGSGADLEKRFGKRKNITGTRLRV
jgi:hypothetical protein